MDGRVERFRDRAEAGDRLGERLAAMGLPRPGVVVGLARGGVSVAVRVATKLALPLDVLTVRKLGVPGHEELAFGAIATGGHRVLNAHVLDRSGLDATTIDRVCEAQRLILERRERDYRAGRLPLDLASRSAVLVDDGLATGATMAVAIDAARALGATHVSVAVPVGAPESCAAMAARADQVVCLLQPEAFYAVGEWYDAFPEVSDDEVRAALRTAVDEVGRDGPARS